MLATNQQGQTYLVAQQQQPPVNQILLQTSQQQGGTSTKTIIILQQQSPTQCNTGKYTHTHKLRAFSLLKQFPPNNYESIRCYFDSEHDAENDYDNTTRATNDRYTSTTTPASRNCQPTFRKW